MKTKQIQTGKATILVVDLPKGAKSFSNLVCGQLAYWLNDNPKFYKLPEGNWKLLGFADQLTEEQLDNVVSDLFLTNNSVEQLKLLLKVNGIVTVNPYENIDPKIKFNHNDMVENELSMKYKQAESELWVNPAILLKQ